MAISVRPHLGTRHLAKFGTPSMMPRVPVYPTYRTYTLRTEHTPVNINIGMYKRNRGGIWKGWSRHYVTTMSQRCHKVSQCHSVEFEVQKFRSFKSFSNPVYYCYSLSFAGVGPRYVGTATYGSIAQQHVTATIIERWVGCSLRRRLVSDLLRAEARQHTQCSRWKPDEASQCHPPAPSGPCGRRPRRAHRKQNLLYLA